MQAETNQWRDVEMLLPGTPISVVKRARQGCELVKATDFELMCDREIGHVTRRLVFVRNEVREVRLEMRGKNMFKSRMFVGAFAGALVGGLLTFVAVQQRPDAPDGLLNVIPISAVIGGAVGSHIHPRQHGAVVYRR